jgi:hypothetical protein
MRRRTILFAIFLALLLAASMFAPAPFGRTVQADDSNACAGLANAYHACAAHNPDYYKCFHIVEQMQQHGCFSGSGSGASS